MRRVDGEGDGESSRSDTVVEMKETNCVLESDKDGTGETSGAVVLIGKRISVSISEKIWLKGLSVDRAAVLNCGIVCSIDCIRRVELGSVEIVEN